jgi:hypothetical protein
MPKVSIRFSDVVAVVAILIAGMSYFESRESNSFVRQRMEADRILVLRASLDGDDSISLTPVQQDHVVQATIFIFPNEIRRSPVELHAEAAVLNIQWIESGLGRSAEHARERGSVAVIRGELPVGVTTAYLVDGISRVDCSIYKMSYLATAPDVGPVTVKLQGMAISTRGVDCDQLKSAVERLWEQRAVDSSTV